MAKTYEPVGWQNATQIKPATVVINGTEYEVTPELMSGTTPINATNLKHMDDAIKDLYDGGASTTDIVISPEEPTTEDWKIWIDTDEVSNLGSEVVDTLDGNEANKAPSVNAVNNALSKIVESGSNENGSWIKYADGTMICTMIRSANFDMTTGIQWGSLYVWNYDEHVLFPQRFVDIPIVNINEYPQTNGSSSFLINYNKPVITVDSYVCIAVARPVLSTNNNAQIDFHFTARGRWK